MAHECSTCKSNGVVVCIRCGGTKKIANTTCYYCDGTGVTICKACDGTGIVED